MLRFFEPDMEPRWPFSAPSWDSRVTGMQNDTVYQLSPPSSSNLGGSNEPKRPMSSSLFPDLDLCFSEGFLVDSGYCGGINLGSHTDSLNCIPGLDGAVTSSQQPSVTMKANRMINETKEKGIVLRDIKKQKTTPVIRTSNASKQHHNSSNPNERKTPMKRSQKLGDRITALQQLVSPFGKTDTASVLHEASIYIEALHEQIKTIVAPYVGIRSSSRIQQQQFGGERVSLQQRGLCLVPVSPAIINLASEARLDPCGTKRIARGQGVSTDIRMPQSNPWI